MWCTKCPKREINRKFYWVEQPPHSMHRYKVECHFCQGFVKWGTQEQCDADLARSNGSKIFTYELPNSIENYL